MTDYEFKRLYEGQFPSVETCGACDGRGYVREGPRRRPRRCDFCHGRKTVIVEEVD